MPKAYLFDLDGTLWRGGTALPFAVESVLALVEQGAQVRYLTNNSSVTAAGLEAKLAGLGFPVEPGWALGTGPLAAQLAREAGYQRVFAVGSPELEESLQAAGLEVTECDPDLVLAGICRTFTYDLLARAMQPIRAGVPFWATNRDTTFPLEGGRLNPGAGAMVAALEACGGVSPRVVGKPEPDLILAGLASCGVQAEEALVVGDRMDTDIAAGVAAGVPTWLVLTGVETQLPPGQPGGPDLRALLS